MARSGSSDATADRTSGVTAPGVAARAHRDADAVGDVALRDRDVVADRARVVVADALHEQIGHDADDRQPRLVRLGPDALHLVPDRIDARKVRPRERLVDDRDRLARRHVGRRELAAAQERASGTCRSSRRSRCPRARADSRSPAGTPCLRSARDRRRCRPPAGRPTAWPPRRRGPPAAAAAAARRSGCSRPSPDTGSRGRSTRAVRMLSIANGIWHVLQLHDALDHQARRQSAAPHETASSATTSPLLNRPRRAARRRPAVVLERRAGAHARRVQRRQARRRTGSPARSGRARRASRGSPARR